jgi:hypothetical protein
MHTAILNRKKMAEQKQAAWMYQELQNKQTLE